MTQRSNRMKEISDMEVICRVGFESSVIGGQDPRIGSGRKLVKIIILDLQRTVFLLS